MSDTREKMRALILAALMIGSVFGGTVAFSGGVAAAGNGNVVASPSTAGNTADLEYSATLDQDRSVQQIQLDFTPASDFDGGFSGASLNEVRVNGVDTGSPSIAQRSNGGATITVQFSSSQPLNAGDTVTVDLNGFQNPSTNGDYLSTYDFNPQSSGGQTQAILTIGTGSSLDGQITSTQDTVGDTVTAEVASVPAGESVTFEHVYEGTVVNAETKTNDGSSAAPLTADFSAAKNADIRFSQDGSAFDVESYSVENYEVNVLNDVLHGTTSDVRGEILLYNGTQKVLADDTNIDYELYDTEGTSIASGDTDNGEFLITRTFDNEPNAADNTERSSDLDYPSDANSDGEPSYEVYIQEDPNDNNPGASLSTNDGSDIVNVRLDVSAETSPSSVEFGDTADVTGGIVDGDGNGAENYKFAVRDTETDPADDAGIVKERSSTTASNGDFGFTMVFNDAGPWAYGTDVGGDTAAPASDNDFVQYGTFTVDTAQAGVNITGDVGNQQSFQSGYTVEVTDQDGNSLDLSGSGNYDGYVAITGEFEVSDPSPYADDDDVIETVSASELEDFNVNTGSFVRAADLDDDGQVDQIHLQTNSAGQLDFDVIPLDSTVGAELQSGFDVSGDEIDTLYNGVEETSIDTPETPDLAGSDSTTIGAADQINVRNYDIEDPQTDSDFSTSTNIFDDDGPSQVSVLPLATTSGDRLQSDGTTTFRTGSDTNQDLDGLTTYRVQFEAFDENNDRMLPSDASAGSGEVANVERLRITGAGVDGTIVAQDDGSVAVASNSTNVISADYDSTSTGEYTVIVRPTEVTSADEEFNVTVIDSDANTATESTDAIGLQVTEFQVDGETVEEVTAGSTVDVTSVVQNEDNDFVNNGRVRLSQTGTTLDADVDARTAATNINNGAYEFTNVDIGPRGIDDDENGIGEDISELTFTAYQYNDADTNGQVDLEEDEVTRATVETLDLTINDNLEVTYLNASNEYAGNTSDGTFTMTQGVEYDSIAFRLTDDDGPVDLTAGVDGTDVALNDLADTELVEIETSNGGTVAVTFDEDASNPSEGYYVIDDLEQTDNGERDLDSDGDAEPVDTVEEFSGDDTFAFDSANSVNTNTTFTLNIETPTRDQTTNASQTGSFVAAQPVVNTTVTGVAGDNIEFSDQAENEFNTNVSGIETLTIGADREYRVNATVTDALGTPLNGSADENDEVVVEFVDPSSDSSVNFEMLDRDGVEVGDSSSNDFGLADNDDSVDVQNPNGTFTFAIEVTDTDSPWFQDGTYEAPFIVGKQTDFDAANDDDAEEGPALTAENYVGVPQGSAGEAEGYVTALEADRPVVEVYDRSGATLPTSEDDEDRILAQDVENRLRIEAFPADENDFALSDGLSYGFNDPKAENTAGTTTTLSDDVVTRGYDQGQLGFVRVTPTGTGDAILDLTDAVDGSGDVVNDQNGTAVHFDVLSSNLQVDITLSSSSVEAGENVTATLTQRSTGESLPANTRVALVDPDGTQVTSALTNSDGEAELAVPANASTSGTYTVETRPAGFAPNSADLNVNAPEAPASVTFDDVTVQNGTTTVTVDSVSLDDGGFVVIHDSNISTDGAIPSAIGASAYLEPGTTENVTVELERPITENETLIAMAHRDTNGNETYDFVTSGGQADGPYTFGGSAVVDSASVTVEADAGGDDEVAQRFGGDDGEIGNLDVLRAVNAANNGEEIGGEPVSNLDVLQVVNAANDN